MLKEAIQFILEKTNPTPPEMFEVNGAKAAFVPNNISLKIFEETREKPLRIACRQTFLSAESFVAYYLRYANQDKAIVFACEDSRKIYTVIDAHEKESPDWQDHVASLNLIQSLEFKAWQKMSGQYVIQKKFAEFLEENLDDVIEPSGAAMYEIATNLSSAKATSFRSAVNLQNGNVGLEFVETDTQTISIPKTFKIRIPIFENGDLYDLNVRFKYNIDKDGALTICYEIAKQERMLKIAFNDMVEKVAAMLNGKAILRT